MGHVAYAISQRQHLKDGWIQLRLNRDGQTYATDSPQDYTVLRSIIPAWTNISMFRISMEQVDEVLRLISEFGFGLIYIDEPLGQQAQQAQE